MSMWEPRSSHLYVCTGLRVCERFCVCVGTPCLHSHHGHSGAGRACQCVPWCVRVFRAHGLWTLSSAPLHLCSVQCVSTVRDPVCRALLYAVCELARVGVGTSCWRVCLARGPACGPPRGCVWAHVSESSDYPSAHGSPLLCVSLCVCLLPRGGSSRP